jgi:hypothetical protein
MYLGITYNVYGTNNFLLQSGASLETAEWHLPITHYFTRHQLKTSSTLGLLSSVTTDVRRGKVAPPPPYYILLSSDILH